MIKFSSIATLALLATSPVAQAAPDVTVGGVVYTWTDSDPGPGYVAQGWDESTPIRSLHICSVVNDLDVVGIAPRAFEYNTDIEYLVIDEGITAIADNAFSRCYNLAALVLPDGLAEIGEDAFAFCTSLTQVVVPLTVTNIGAHAFAGCTAVTDAYFVMTGADELADFDWWDGIYHDAPSEGGGVEFATVAGTTIRVPRGTRQTYVDSHKFDAWLDNIVEDDDSYPLWWIVNYGTVGRSYTVSDDLTGVYIGTDGALYAKDDNHWLMPDRPHGDEVDYMPLTGLMRAGATYDQSNWVALSGVANAVLCLGHRVNGGTITGTLTSKRNPAITVTSTPVPGDEQQYDRNVYIPASLMSRTQVAATGTTYAFVRPKPQEVADYAWSIYAGDDEFYMPAPDAEAGMNRNELKGGYGIAYDLYERPANIPALTVGGYYAFTAVTRLAEPAAAGSAPRREPATLWEPYVDGGLTTAFTVLPLRLPDEPIITAIEAVNAGPSGRAGALYDLHGHRLATPPAGPYVDAARRAVVLP